MLTMKKIIRFTKIACSQSVVIKATKISLVVGTLLNMINQGDILVSMQWNDINVSKLFLTFLVPYSVTTYTAVSMQLEFTIGRYAAISADLECRNCHQKVRVKENTLIPECPTCKVFTKWKIA